MMKKPLVIFKFPGKVLLMKEKLNFIKKAKSIQLGQISWCNDRLLHWHDQMNNTAIKLNRANALLLKTRNHVNTRKITLTPT